VAVTPLKFKTNDPQECKKELAFAFALPMKRLNDSGYAWYKHQEAPRGKSAIILTLYVHLRKSATRRRMNTRVINALLILGVWCSLAAATPAATRVAILPAENNDHIQAVTELCETLLSQDHSVMIVDRADIEMVLREQEWQLGGVIDTTDGLRIGSLLQTDVLAVLQQPDAASPPALIVFDAATGVRLVDTVLPDASLAVQVEAAAAAIRLALEKRNRQDGSIHTIGLLSIQNVDLPPQQQFFVQSIGDLLLRRLLHAPSVTILERSHLDRINEERTLPGVSTSNALLSSVCLLELTIERSPSDGNVTISAHLTGASGVSYGNIVFDAATDAAGITEALAREITTRLEVAPPVASNRREEALRYLSEARWQSRHKQTARAVRAAEAAYALDPESTDGMEDLARYRMQHAFNLRDDTSPLFASSALDMLFLLRARHIIPDAEHELFYYMEFRQPAGRHSALHNQRMRELQRHYRNYLRIDEAPDDPTQWLTKDMSPEYAITRLALASPSSRDYIPRLQAFITHWLQEIASNPDAWRGYNLGQVMRTIHDREHHVTNPEHHYLWFDCDNYYYEGLLEIFSRIEQHPLIFVAPYGRLGKLYCRRETKKLTPQQLLPDIQELDRQIRSIIAHDKTCRAADRYMLYLFLLDLYDLILDDSLRHQLYFDLFDFMVQQKTLVYPVAHAATSSHAGFRDYTTIEKSRALGASQRRIAAANEERFHDMVRNLDTYEYWESNQRDREEVERRQRILAAEKKDTPDENHPPVWEETRCLFDVKDYPDVTIVERVFVQNHRAYILSSRQDRRKPTRLRLDRVDLSGGPSIPVATGSLLVTQSYPIDMFPAYPDAMYFGPICRQGNMTWIPTYGHGLLRLRDDSTLEQWSTTNGLPSDYIQSITFMNDTLYVASGEIEKAIFLSAYDTQNKTWKLLASSLRRSPENPLDNASPPFIIRAMQPDPERNRILFTVDYGLDINNEYDYSPLIGVWSFNTHSQTFKQLLQLYRSPRWVSPVGNQYMLLAPWSNNPYQPGSRYRPWQGLVVFDAETDTAGIIMEANTRPVSPSLKRTDAGLHTQHEVSPPFAVYRNGIWFIDTALNKISFNDQRTGFRIIPPDAHRERLPELITAGDEANLLLVKTHRQVHLIEFDPGQVLRESDWDAFLSRPVPVHFAYRFPDARRVVIAGDFNEWDTTATPCRRDNSGTWTADLLLHPGQYGYKLVVDEAWMRDPLHTNTILDREFLNSRLTVPSQQESGLPEN
jgi:hypothetical protein